MIIGISGYMGSGKDAVAKFIQELTKEKFVSAFVHYDESPWEIKKFAGKLKQMVSLMTGIPVEDLEKQEVKDSHLPIDWGSHYFVHGQTGEKVYLPFGTDLDAHKRRYSHIGADKISFEFLTVRALLQKLGTDAIRDRVHKNAWVNALFANYKLYKNYTHTDTPEMEYPKWIISDMRFPNEMEAIKERGGLTIRVVRPQTEGQITRHESETALDKAEFDFVIHNDGSLEHLKEIVKEYLKSQNII